jgi:hypothetical protein
MSDRVHLDQAEGQWWVTIECPEHGVVDEAVPWNRAKTPRSAAILAADNHASCLREQLDEEWETFRIEQVAAAEREVERADTLLRNAEIALAAAEGEAERLRGGDEEQHMIARQERLVDDARRRVETYARGPADARHHLDLAKANVEG